jgi:tRNA pseudouridine55 synthase
MNNQSGFFLINKPKGWTSHDVVDKMRVITGIRQIGHAGTLDPAATGLLILGIGRATKELAKIIGLDKEYEAEIELGQETDTYDSEGIIVQSPKLKVKSIDSKDVEKILKQFIGEQEQVPPMYSARKIKGKKLYELARQGQVVERPVKKITIYKIDWQDYQWPILKIKIKCSSGTYIRSLAHDIGQKLGCGAYLKTLTRTSIGQNQLSNAQELSSLNKDNWLEQLKTINELIG